MSNWIKACLAALMCMAIPAFAGTLTFDTYYHNDHLGSPVAATDERSDLLWRAHFRPYGERQENPTEAAFGNVGYTGHMQGADSNLVYMQARYYDPMIGRFLAVDPVGVNSESPASFNRYAYANNNPIRFFDPDGRMSDDAILHGGWVPGFEGNLYNGSMGWGPISGPKRGLTPQGELVSEGKVNSAGQPINDKGQFVSGAGGESASAARGRAAHEAFDAKVQEKIDKGWVSRPRIVDADGRVHIPDALTPSGRPIEYKPNTPSGIKAGTRQLKRYEQVTGKKGRLLTYD